MNQKKPGGIICPVATPLTDGEGLDVKSFHRLLERILSDLDGVFVLGSTGEFAFLSDQVADRIIEVTLEFVAGRLPVYIGCSDAGTKRAVERLERAKRAGIDFVVATSHYYYSINDQQALVDHFTTIADASPLPVILYNIPQNTGVALKAATTQKLAEHENIIGIKDSWGDMFLFQEFLALRNERFIVMQGREQLSAASLWLGADGIVSALPNIAPRMLQQLVNAIRSGEREEALKVQRAITRLAQVFEQGYWVSGLKAALYELGIGNGSATQPIPRCTPGQFRYIRQLLQEADLLPEKEGAHV